MPFPLLIGTVAGDQKSQRFSDGPCSQLDSRGISTLQRYGCAARTLRLRGRYGCANAKVARTLRLRGRYCCADATAYVAEIRIIGPMLHRVCQDLLTCRKSVTKLTHFLKMCLMIKFGLGKPSVFQNAGITFFL